MQSTGHTATQLASLQQRWVITKVMSFALVCRGPPGSFGPGVPSVAVVDEGPDSLAPQTREDLLGPPQHLLDRLLLGRTDRHGQYLSKCVKQVVVSVDAADQPAALRVAH